MDQDAISTKPPPPQPTDWMRVLVLSLGSVSLVVGALIGMTPGGGLLIGAGFGGVVLAAWLWPRGGK
jgi:hypothetical protein